MSARVRAPELRGRGWLNTGGRVLSLADLRGKIVLVTLDVVFTPAPGQKLDESFGPSTRLEISASPPEFLLDGTGVTTDLSRRLVINPAVTKGILQVVAQAATCDVDAEFPACHLTRQDWGVPVVIEDGAPTRLPLILRGLDE